MFIIDPSKKTVTFGHFPEPCFPLLALIIRRRPSESRITEETYYFSDSICVQLRLDYACFMSPICSALSLLSLLLCLWLREGSIEDHCH